MNFKKLLKLLCCILLLLVIVFRFIKLYSANNRNLKYKTYTVAPGETLWSIAEDNCPSMDPRKVIFIIRNKNEITPLIYAGQELMVPVIEE